MHFCDMSDYRLALGEHRDVAKCLGASRPPVFGLFFFSLSVWLCSGEALSTFLPFLFAAYTLVERRGRLCCGIRSGLCFAPGVDWG